MKILVLSCDKNEDTFELFHHCIEKYYPEHPEIIYAMETKDNPYYKTIKKDYPLEQWTRRIRETLKDIDDDQILIMIDDIFIHNPVDTKRIEYASKHLTGNIALFNFEKEYDNNNIDVGLDGFKLRRHGSIYEISIMCGLWNKEKLIHVLEEDSDPWTVEYRQKTKGYDYYINSGDYIIDWGYANWVTQGIVKGKWTRSMVDFAKKEGIKIDFEKRGFYV